MNTNLIVNSDCLLLLKELDDGCVDLFLQDTPFGVTQNDWDIVPDFDVMWKEWLRVGKDNCAFIFFATQPFAADLINSNRKLFRYDLIWYKRLGSGFLNANKMPMRNHEMILIFYKELPTFNPQKTIGKMREKGRRDTSGDQSSNYGKYNPALSVNNEYYPQSVLDFTNGDRTSESDHPTQKSLDLFRYLIKTYSNEGDIVFDGYSGSGTTAIAATIEKRNFICCENNEAYFTKSVKRLAEQRLQPQLDFTHIKR